MRRVIAHAAIAFGIAFALTAMAIATFASLPAANATRASAFIALCAGAAAGVASFLSQRGRRPFIVLTAALAVLAVGAGTCALLPHAPVRHASYELTSADRAPLVVDTSVQPPRFRHPTLGFSFIKPDGFTETPQLTQVLASKLGSGTIVYGYTNASVRASMSVLILPAPGNGAGDLSQALDDFVQGMTQHESSASVIDRAIGSNEGHVHVTVRGGHLRATIHLVPAGTGWVYVLLVVGSTNPSVLADVMASFAT
ncbi:MAG TPA: hypothetical protein VGL61_25415 [Kofleriaceae bacterium]|jgi:hypothetical protein